MKTRDRIIVEATHLFNSHGVQNVSTRDIAKAVQISHGNLTYHFPSKSVIIGGIYTYLEDFLDGRINPRGKFTLQHMDKLLYVFAKVREQYRFLFLDIVEIGRIYPAVAQKHGKIMTKRLREIRALLEHYASIGLLQHAKNAKQFDQLAHSIWFMSAFWLSQEVIVGKDRQEASVEYGIEMIWNLVIPHLTQKGLVEYYFLRNIND